MGGSCSLAFLVGTILSGNKAPCFSSSPSWEAGLGLWQLWFAALSSAMCHVASARRMALKLGLELCGGGGGFQAPGPGVGGRGWEAKGEKGGGN